MIIIKVHGIGRLNAFVNKLSKQIPELSKKALYNTARFGASELKKQARLVGLQPWGGGAKSIFRDTIPVKISNQQWQVKMPIHGVWQDRAPMHFVPVQPAYSRGRFGVYMRKVDRWAQDRGFQGGGFMFRPRPFINTAINNTIRRAEQIMREELEKMARAK